MNVFRRICLIGIILTISTLTVYAQDDPTEQEEDIEQVTTLYQETFTEVIRENDTTALVDLFLNRQLPLYVVQKTANGPRVDSQGLTGWLGVVRTRPQYEIVVSEPQVTVLDNIALTVAHFDESIGNYLQSSGTDVFIYVKLDGTWKIATMNVTLVNANDRNDYTEAHEIDNEIETIVNDVEVALNTHDEEAFLSYFTKNSAYYLQMDQLSGTEFDPTLHSAEMFIDTWPEDMTVSFSEINITIYDQYIGIVMLDYAYKQGNEVMVTGHQIWSFVADANDGWQISSISTTVNDNDELE